MFIAALFTIAKIWKQPKCPSVDEWIKKMGYVCVYIHTHTHTPHWDIYTIYTHPPTHTMECYSAIKNMKSCHL